MDRPKTETTLATPEARKSLRRKIIERTAAVAGGTALALELVACAPTAATEPRETVAASGNETPAPSPSAIETEAPEAEAGIEIPAGLEATEVGERFINTGLSKWFNNGAEPDLLKNRDRSITEAENIAKIVAETQDEFANALFIPGWENDVNLAHYVDSYSTVHTETLTNYWGTQWSGDTKPENKEGYTHTMTLVGAEEVDDGDPNDNQRTINFTVTEESNADMNEINPLSNEGVPYEITATLTEIDGREYISAINAHNIEQ